MWIETFIKGHHQIAILFFFDLETQINQIKVSLDWRNFSGIILGITLKGTDFPVLCAPRICDKNSI